jgi:hypothetical protein
VGSNPTAGIEVKEAVMISGSKGVRRRKTGPEPILNMHSLPDCWLSFPLS